MERILKFFKLILLTNHKKIFYYLIFLCLISNITEMFGFLMVIPLIMIFLNDGLGVIGVGYIDKFINEIINNDLGFNPLVIVIFFISVAFLIKLLIYSYTNYKIFTFSENIGIKISNKIFLAELDKDYSEQYKIGSSEKIRKTLYDTLQVAKATSGIVMLISEIILFILIFFIFLSIEVKLLYSFISIFILALIYIKFSKKFVLELSGSQQKKYTDWLRFLQESFGGIKMIKLNNSELFFSNAHRIVTQKYFQQQKKLDFIYLLPKIFFESLLLIFFLVIIIFTKFILNIPNNIVVPILGLLALTAVRLVPSIYKIVVNYQNIVQAEPYLNGLYDAFLSKKKLIKKNSFEMIEDKPILFNETLKIQNLCFQYNTGEFILNNINISILKNEIVGIYGQSGSGKTTFVDLVAGLINPTSGKILVDNFDISKNVRAWQKKIGYVSQETFLVDDDLQSNIIFSKKNNLDQRYLDKIIALLKLDKLLLNNKAGERGVKLSGGEKQKIGIARALVEKPDLLILDEFTSSLDQNSENEILSIVHNLKKEISTTIIMISHRKNPFKICDKIFKLINQNLFLETK
jgi:ABC-type multidrug transport system fused ATPase/permease subunit